MKLILSQIDGLTHYTGKPFPKWGAKMHPEAAAAVRKLEAEQGPLSYTDIFRTADISLHAAETKQGVQPPGYSAHNYGLSIDFDIDGTLKNKGWTYAQLLEVLSRYGFHCHRRDGKSGLSEAWHFNYFPPDQKDQLLRLADPRNASSWAVPVETRIKQLYANDFILTTRQAQEALAKLKLYNIPVDDDVGPVMRQAVSAFQRTWKLGATGALDLKTMRTLALVAADQVLV